MARPSDSPENSAAVLSSPDWAARKLTRVVGTPIEKAPRAAARFDRDCTTILSPHGTNGIKALQRAAVHGLPLPGHDSAVRIGNRGAMTVAVGPGRQFQAVASGYALAEEQVFSGLRGLGGAAESA